MTATITPDRTADDVRETYAMVKRCTDNALKALSSDRPEKFGEHGIKHVLIDAEYDLRRALNTIRTARGKEWI